VYSVERHASLARDAETILHQVGLNNVRVTIGDGSYGLTEFAPYGAIVVSAAVPAVPASLLEQLSEHGRMVIPVGTPDAQELQLVRKQGASVSIEVIEGCRFVPLIGAEGF
jgi:protein-L-isoaspartate(D-aspartate) O-methyltransferase